MVLGEQRKSKAEESGAGQREAGRQEVKGSGKTRCSEARREPELLGPVGVGWGTVTESVTLV